MCHGPVADRVVRCVCSHLHRLAFSETTAHRTSTAKNKTQSPAFIPHEDQSPRFPLELSPQPAPSIFRIQTVHTDVFDPNPARGGMHTVI